MSDSAQEKRRALGKGIHAIIPERTQAALAAEFRPIPVDEIRPNPFQPRGAKQWENDPKFQELVASIKEKGVLQPVVVRRRRDGYELVAGERRWRAAKAAGLTTVPAVVRAVEDREMLEQALVENLQREDLNPIEEALAYKKLADEFHLTHEEIARRVGKDRSTVTNALRLLALPFRVRDALAAGLITAGHARALLSINSRREQVELCERVINEGLSVRTLERLCGEGKRRVRQPEKEKDVHIKELEEALQEVFQTRVIIFPAAGEKKPGRLVIEFFSEEDLNRIVKILKRQP
ncbi:ParB/RepB/Spo0J family partition protein [candidate division WOR-3 bacterium]|nr:ParB/RepB/Spo0J family partition protein [candidate division WOR-3 bacterium]